MICNFVKAFCLTMCILSSNATLPGLRTASTPQGEYIGGIFPSTKSRCMRKNFILENRASSTSGNFIELGVRTTSDAGKFGTDESVSPPGFFGRFGGRSGIGMVSDADGFNTGSDLRIDYFLPGTPAEEYSFGFGGSSVRNGANSVAQLPSLDPNVAQIVITDTFGDLEMTQVISLGVDDKLFRGDVTLRNTGMSTLEGVRFMRSHDPDNTVSAQVIFN